KNNFNFKIISILKTNASHLISLITLTLALGPKLLFKSTYVPHDGAWRGRIRCSNCNRFGHTSGTCRQLAPVNNVNLSNNATSTFKRFCSKCKSTSHFYRQCPLLKAQKVNQVSVVSVSTEEATTEVKKINRVQCVSGDVLSTSSDQWVKPIVHNKEQVVKVNFGIGF